MVLDGPRSIGEISADFSYSAKGDLDHNGKIGSVKIDHYGFDASVKIPLSADLRLMSGVAVSRDDLSLTGMCRCPTVSNQ